MTENKNSTSSRTEAIPFGAMEMPRRSRKQTSSTPRESSESGGSAESRGEGGSARPGRRRRSRRRKTAGGNRPEAGAERASGAPPAETRPDETGGRPGTGKNRTRRKKRWKRERGGSGGGGGAPQSARTEAEGLYLVEHAGHGHLRLRERMWIPSKQDVHVAPHVAQRFGLRDGSIVKGAVGPGHGRHKHELLSVSEVDGRPPKETRSVPQFKSLCTIDPDYHYAVGTMTGDLSLRVLDLICPVGRGQRGLVVAPPRSGKTILMQKFAKAIEDHYEDVHPMVLLVDERPEEATEWTRLMQRGEVFVSTNDEPIKNHVQLCEAVWKRCQRLVELGEDVVLVLDSITRMARAYNHVHGNSGKTMSGGLDSRAMERPKQFFGAARNTETAGSLTILGTTLVETGSRMDQVIFEEFKGTGNMELVLSRKLADRRVFPAIDVERSGTRKEEKLVPRERLRLTHTLRRVLTKMHFAEAMELLLTRLEDCETNDEFLARFQIDPEE